MSDQIWINGSMQSVDEARISPFDHGVTVGDGVFETLVGRDGEPFAFTRHYQRLERSARAMGLAVRPLDELREASRSVVDVNGLREGLSRIRITVTGGPAPLGSERGDALETTMVAATPAPGWGESADVSVVPFTRNESGALVGLKTTSYGENVVALAHAKARGAGEAIFANTKGQLCEGTGTNVFLVVEDEFITPPLAAGCLAGVTRALVLELCAREGIAVVERNVPITALHQATEAFLSSTTRDVQPIRKVDGTPLPKVPGEITGKLQVAFGALVREQIDP